VWTDAVCGFVRVSRPTIHRNAGADFVIGIGRAARERRPGPSTDPDVRISRIRLPKARVRFND